MKPLLLAAALACALHALLLAARVDWKGGKTLSPGAPLLMALSYRAPEEPAPTPMRPAPSARKDPDLSAPKSHTEPKRTLHPQGEEKKTFPEFPAKTADRDPEPTRDEKPGAASATDTPAPNPTGEKAAGLSEIPGSLAHVPSLVLPQPPLRQAVPLYLKNPPPEYPPAARRRGYEGTALLDVFVDQEGRVQELRLSASSGHDVLDRAAMKAVRGWIFEPAMQGGERVAMWVRVPLTFRLTP